MNLDRVFLPCKEPGIVPLTILFFFFVSWHVKIGLLILTEGAFSLCVLGFWLAKWFGPETFIGCRFQEV